MEQRHEASGCGNRQTAPVRERDTSENRREREIVERRENGGGPTATETENGGQTERDIERDLGV